MITKLIMESFRFAWNALKMNAFRTTLSLLGVTVGIFAIIGVFTVVDSLEKSIRDSLNFLGTGVIYVNKWPFTVDDEGDGDPTPVTTNIYSWKRTYAINRLSPFTQGTVVLCLSTKTIAIMKLPW